MTIEGSPINIHKRLDLSSTPASMKLSNLVVSSNSQPIPFSSSALPLYDLNDEVITGTVKAEESNSVLRSVEAVKKHVVRVFSSSTDEHDTGNPIPSHPIP